jgi:hypothetical protein
MLLVDNACLEPIAELYQAPKAAVLTFLVRGGRHNVQLASTS